MVATLHDRREFSETFTIEYVDAPPVGELVVRLEKIRRENEALIDQIKHRMVTEMKLARARKHLELRAEE